MKKLSLMFACFAVVVVVSSPNARAVEWVKYSENPIITPAPGNSFVARPWVIGDGSTYRMYYKDGWGISLAQSTDGSSWTKYNSGTPVLVAAGGWEGSQMGGAAVIKEGSTYKMWYSSSTGSSAQTGLATSSDGIEWNRDGSNNPVLPTRSGEFDSRSAEVGSVIFADGKYRMWYNATYDTNTQHRTIGYADSSDGIAWTNRFISLSPLSGSPFAGALGVGSVVREGDGYTMYFNGENQDNTVGVIGRVHTNDLNDSDGITFDVSQASVILTPGTGEAWDNHSLSGPNLATVNGQNRLYYAGQQVSLVNGNPIGLGMAVPEPSTLLLAVVGGLFGVCCWLRRK